MGGSCSRVDLAADDSTVTEQDKKVVTNTWQQFYKDWETKHGMAFFIRLFTNQPDVKRTFKSFAHLSEEELLESSALQGHVVAFGSNVSTWISKLNDTETLVGLIQKLTDGHVGRGVIDPAFFKAALQELLAYMTEIEGLKPAQVSSWTKIANLIASVIEDRIKELKG